MDASLRRTSVVLRATLLLVFVAPLLWETGESAAQDIPGSGDHPVLGRIPRAVIVQHERRDYDVLRFPVSGKGYRIEKVQEAAGAAWRIVYRLPERVSPAAAQGIYRSKLRELGFRELYACRNQGVLWYDSVLRETGDVRWTYANPPERIHCLVARGMLQGRRAMVAVYSYLAVYKEGWLPTVRLYVVESARLDARLEVMKAERMAEEIGAKGRVALYGILFDHDSAAIRPESEKAIAEIARYLLANPDVKLYVVGHTDNTGTYEYNLALSQRRAEAVVRALTGKHGIAAVRLKPVGVGPVAPVASNTTDEGRAKNRRVELVAQ